MTVPSLPASSTILFALHIVLLHPHIYLAIRHKTYQFLFLLGMAMVFEVAGQIFHTLHQPEPFTSCATLFLCAAIHGLWVKSLDRCSQKWEAYTRFLVAEVIATCVVGGGAGAAWKGHADMGEAMIQAGMGWFAGSILVLSGVLWCYSSREEMESAVILKKTEKFHGGLVCATLCVLIRVCFRLTEWTGWFGSGMIETESAVTLDGTIMLLAVLILAIVHPGQLCQTQSWRARRRLHKYQAESGDEKLQGDEAVAG